MNVHDWLENADRRSTTPTPEIDALIELDALVECALTALSIDHVRSRAIFLFDCRGALNIEDSNTAVLAVYGLSSLSVTRAKEHKRRWPAILGWSPRITGEDFSVSIVLQDHTEWQAQAEHAEYYEGDVPGMDGPTPDLAVASAEELWNALPHEFSEFAVHGGSFTLP